MAKFDPKKIIRKPLKTYTFLVPEEYEYEPKQLGLMLDKLLSYYPSSLFRIVATSEVIEWEWTTFENFRDQFDDFPKQTVTTDNTIIEAVKNYLPEVEVEIYEDFWELPEGMYHLLQTYTYDYGENAKPIPYLWTFGKITPLVNITQVMSLLQEDEEILFNVSTYWDDENSRKREVDGILTTPMSSRLESMILGVEAKKKFKDTAGKYPEIKLDKLSHKCYRGLLYFEVIAHSADRAVELAQSVRTYLDQYQTDLSGKYALMKLSKFSQEATATRIQPNIKYFDLLRSKVPSSFWSDDWAYGTMMLNGHEFASLWQLPTKQFTAPNIRRNVKDNKQVSEALAENKQGFSFGYGKHKGEQVLVKIPEETLATHMSILGKSGMGKSTFLVNTIRQVIDAGHGCAVLDPHGDLVRDILQTAIPPEREQDVVVLDLNDENMVIPMNVFSGSDANDTMLGQVVTIISTAQKREAGDQTERYLYYGLGAISNLENPTFLDFQKFLMDDEYRDQVLDIAHTHGDLDTVDFWELEYNELSSSGQKTKRDPVINRLEIFIRNKLLRPVLCHPDGLPLTEWMSSKKIVLLSLGANPLQVSDDQKNLLGAMFISMLQMAGMNPNRERIPFYIFADEMQRFKTPAFPTIFSEARKYKLSLTIAHQYADQLDNEILSAIIGNVGTKVIFGCGVTDARRLGVTVKDAFESSELERLDKYTMALRTVLEGATQPSCLIGTLPPPDKPENAPEIEARIRELSRQTYTPKTREDINKWFAERYPRRRSRNRDVSATEEPSETTSGDDIYG